jgi:chromosome segregation ATPase
MHLSETTLLTLLIISAIFLVMWLLGLRKSKNLRQKLDETQKAAEAKISATKNEAEKQVSAVNEKYAHLISRDDAIAERDEKIRELEHSISNLRNSYSEKKQIFDKLLEQVAIYDDRLAFAELGVYEPHFDFQDSETFKEEIKKVRADQKTLVSAKTACICPTDWTVDGSRSKGQTMVNRQMRLTMRAFNNECEAAIANTRWNNVNAMEKRIENAATQINKSNESMSLSIAPYYVQLKLKELYLTHEYREKLKQEKDERAEQARLEREEKRLEKEAEAAEREERKYQKLLEQARKEAGLDENRIAELEEALAEAHEKTERAKAMATYHLVFLEIQQSQVNSNPSSSVFLCLLNHEKLTSLTVEQLTGR